MCQSIGPDALKSCFLCRNFDQEVSRRKGSPFVFLRETSCHLRVSSWFLFGSGLSRLGIIGKTVIEKWCPILIPITAIMSISNGFTPGNPQALRKAYQKQFVENGFDQIQPPLPPPAASVQHVFLQQPAERRPAQCPGTQVVGRATWASRGASS